MNQKAIGIIIGLMSAALVGIGCLQIYWIGGSVRLGEEQFDKNVFAALNRVSERVQEYENAFAMRLMNLNEDDLPRVESSDIDQQLVGAAADAENYPLEVAFQEYISSDSSSIARKQYIRPEHATDCNCRSCQLVRLSHIQNLYELRKIKNSMKRLLIEDRIDGIGLANFDAIIRDELANLGIRLPYNYGLMATNRKTFVVKDNHYLSLAETNKILPSNAGKTLDGDDLTKTEYKVPLFSADLRLKDDLPPGILMIRFPEKGSFLWSTVWKTLLAAILFTAIILFCFTYTIKVIFRQKKVSEMKTDFINNMTHEFKTPIATISLATDAITSPMVMGQYDKIRRFADIIRQENRRMNSQVEKVLQIAWLEKDDFQLNVTDINLHDVIRQAVANSNLQVEKKGGLVTAYLEAQHPVIEGDITHISNIIYNLLDNANKYSPENPKISILTRNISSGIEVIVADEGIGMNKEVRKLIFDKFYRVPTGDLHDVKGFGLGLSYVRVMTAAHKGQIDVKSELGKGSSFILSFPFKQ